MKFFLEQNYYSILTYFYFATILLHYKICFAQLIIGLANKTVRKILLAKCYP